MTRSVLQSGSTLGAPGTGAITDAQLPSRLQDGQLSATYVPKWKANTAYLAGDAVLSPAGDTVTAKANFTSGASFNAANWNLSPTYQPLALPKIPTTPDLNGSLISYGHSFLAEQGLTDTGGYYARQAAARLGLTYPTAPGGTANALKRAVGGSRAEDMVVQVMNGNPYAAGTKSLIVMQCLINSARLHGNDPVAVNSATQALRAALATICASSRVEETDPAFAYNPAFTSAASSSASGGNWKFNVSTGAYVEVVTPPTPAYIIFTGKQAAGPTITVTDSSNAGAVTSFDLSYQITASPDTPTSNPYAYKVPTALQGHTLRFTKSDAGASSITVDVMLPQSADAPRVVLMKEPYLLDYSRSTMFPNGSDAALDAFNAIIDTMAAEFPNVIVADPNKAGYWDKTIHIGSDGVHPNQAGHDALARTVVDAVLAAAVRRTIAGQAKSVGDSTYVAFTDPRIGGRGDGITDNTAAFNAALALLAPTGGTLFFPAGVYLINGATDPVPGGVWLTGTGYDYHTPSSSFDKPKLMSVIRATATMTRLIQLGSDATVSTSGATGASIRNLIVDGNNFATTTVKTAGRRNRILDSQVYFGTTNALWIAGQNTHVVGSVIAQQDTGDVILINGYYDNKIWDCQIRQPGTTGACIHLVGGGSDQTDIQRNHLWAGANAVAAAAKALIWLEATSSNGVINTLIQDNTIEGVLGPEILLQGTAGSAGIRGTVITGNRFYQNTNMPSDNTYAVVDSSGASLSSIVIANNVINGNTATLRYKSILNLGAAITATSRITIIGNVGLYVASVLSGIVAPTPIYQRANHINNGTANVRSDNSGQVTLSGTGSATAFTIAHGLASTPSSVRVTPGSAAAATPFYVTSDATNITVTFTTAPASGTNNVVLNWNADG